MNIDEIKSEIAKFTHGELTELVDYINKLPKKRLTFEAAATHVQTHYAGLLGELARHENEERAARFQKGKSEVFTEYNCLLQKLDNPPELPDAPPA